MSRPPLMQLGVIGLPHDWDGRYAPALSRLKHRVGITTVFDHIISNARRTASAVSARSEHGLRRFLQTFGGNVVLLLQTGWHGDWALGAASRMGVPTFVGRDILRSLPSWTAIDKHFVDDQSIIVPECLWRYQPSVLRLRELLVTRPGPVTEIEISLHRIRQIMDPGLTLRELLNGLASTFEIGTMASIDCPLSERGPRTVNLVALASNGRPVRVLIDLTEHTNTDGATGAESTTTQPLCVVTCNPGRLALYGPRTLEWTIGGETVREDLAGERSATDVALDHFARRAVGGLIPIPSFTDLAVAQQQADRILAECPTVPF